MLMCSRLQVYLGLLTDVAYTAAARYATLLFGVSTWTIYVYFLTIFLNI